VSLSCDAAINQCVSSCERYVVFDVAADLAYCEGDDDLSVGLLGSQIGVLYRVYRVGNEDPVDTGVLGTGAALRFPVPSAGTYLIRAVNDEASCALAMNGTSVVATTAHTVAGTATVDNATVCAGVGTTVRLSGYSGSIQWQTSPNGISGWLDIPGATSSAYMTGALVNSTSYRARVGAGSCATVTSNVTTVLVIATPLQPSEILGDPEPRKGATGQVYSVVNQSGLSYAWTVPGGWSIVAGQGTHRINVTAGSSGGEITVTPNNACASGPARALTVSVLPVPVWSVDNAAPLIADMDPGPEYYRYAGSGVKYDNDHAAYFWCANSVSGQIIDHIVKRTYTYSTNSWSQEAVVLDPGSNTYSTWDGAHACDPEVVAGSFKMNSIAYSWAMLYLGAQDHKQTPETPCIDSSVCAKNYACGNPDTGGTRYCAIAQNAVGVAFSNSLDGPWVKYPQALVPFPPSCPDNGWGAGQPSATLIRDGVLMLVYHDCSSPTGPRRRILDLTDFNGALAPVTNTQPGSSKGPVFDYLDGYVAPLAVGDGSSRSARRYSAGASTCVLDRPRSASWPCTGHKLAALTPRST